MIKKLQNFNLLRALKLIRFEKKTIYLLIIAACIGLNILVLPIALKADFSFGKAYTLSPATKTILRNMKDTVSLELYVSSDLPTKLLPLRTDVVDLLNEYKSQTNKIQVKILDPKKDQSAAAQAEQKGVPQLQFSQLEQGKYAVTATYFGIAILNGDKKEVIPQVSDPASLEYNLTAAIYKLTREELPRIGVIGYDDAQALQQGDNLGTLKQVLGQQFLVETIPTTPPPAEGEESTEETPFKIDQAYKTIMVFDTGIKKYTQAEINAFKTYINNKGKAIFFVDGVQVNNDLTSAAAEHNLFGLLDQYGLTLNKNLVLSASAELVNFGNQSVNFLTPYPFWIKAGLFNGQSSYFANLTQLVFPWVSSVTPKAKNGFTPRDLVKTPTQSWAQTSNFTLNPQSIAQPKQEDLKQYLIGAETTNKNGSTVVVIPSSRFVVEQFLGNNNDNLELIVNITNELASGGALSGIRARSVGIYPLPDLTEQGKDIFKYVNMLALPALLALYGAWRLFSRKK